MSVSYKELYLNRCVRKGDLVTPTFWRPPTMEKEAFGFWGSSDDPIPEEWGVERLMQVIIGMGLMLELPVGEFIRSGMKGDLPVEVDSDGTDYVRKLFLTNSADEGRHYQGMQNAAACYPVPDDILSACDSLREAWVSLDVHPILKAGSLEAAIFLVNLGIMRLYGTPCLATLGRGIALDERRHVTTNRHAVIDLGLNPWSPGKALEDLMIDSFQFLFQGYNPVDSEDVLGIKADKDFFIRSGMELLKEGSAKELDALVRTVDYSPAFEVANASLYDRDVVTDVESLLAVA